MSWGASKVSPKATRSVYHPGAINALATSPSLMPLTAPRQRSQKYEGSCVRQRGIKVPARGWGAKTEGGAPPLAGPEKSSRVERDAGVRESSRNGLRSSRFVPLKRDPAEPARIDRGSSPRRGRVLSL
ncbi:hypothetical protein KM043_010195 [Ampulex compressa]|nr:hypothetical protein KM043_010195 [Ampulex compressa]